VKPHVCFGEIILQRHGQTDRRTDRQTDRQRDMSVLITALSRADKQ